MDQQGAIGPDERRTLELAPFWILSAVVGRYRGFNQPTLDALDRLLRPPARPRGRRTTSWWAWAVGSATSSRSSSRTAGRS